VVGADRHHIAHPQLPDAAVQLTAAVYLIAYREGGADPAGVRAFQQLAGQLRLGTRLPTVVIVKAVEGRLSQSAKPSVTLPAWLKSCNWIGRWAARCGVPFG
jgi:hypothetical protein